MGGLKHFVLIGDNNFGGLGHLANLIIVGNDFWLERHKYRGLARWEFKTMPTKPLLHIKNKIFEIK
jgi:hypothetical protein